MNCAPFLVQYAIAEWYKNNADSATITSGVKYQHCIKCKFSVEMINESEVLTQHWEICSVFSP